MIFKRRSLWDRFLDLWPPRRKRRRNELRDAIEYAMEHPDEEVVVLW